MRITSNLLVLSLFISHVANASTTLPYTDRDPKANQVLIPLLGTNKFITVEEYVNLTPDSYRDITGKKMRFSQKLDLGLSKHFIKKMIRKDGTVDVEKMRTRGFFGGWHWHWGGFALGLFLSLLGPIVALFFNDDYKWDRFWTSLHTAVWVGLIAVVIIAIATGGGY